MKPLAISLPEKLRQCREQKGLTQPDVAEAIGIKSFQTISRWERGEVFPELENLARLADLYGRPVGYFLDQGVDLQSTADRPFSTKARKTIILEAAAVLSAYGRAPPDLQAEVRRALGIDPALELETIDSETSQVLATPAKPLPKDDEGA